jgi:hypothetical protein
LLFAFPVDEMTTVTRTPMQRFQSERATWEGFVVALVGVVLLCWLLSSGIDQWITAAMLVAVGVLLAWVQPNAAVIATLIYLALMGDIRRWAVTAGAGTVKVDPLLLVGPAIVGALFLRLLTLGHMKANTLLSKLVTALMLLMVIEILNPLQGSPIVGLTGGLVYLVPLVWFWVGKALPTEEAAQGLLRRAIPWVGLAAALLGLFQLCFGWLSFEAQWIHYELSQGGLAAMVVNGRTIRPFAFFTSGAEFAGFLALTLACCAAPLVLGRPRWTILLVPVVGTMLFLDAVRTEIVMGILALLSMWIVAAVNGRAMLVRGVAAAVIVVPGLFFGLRSLQDVDSSSQIGDMTAHVVEGLNDPVNSSAAGHVDLNVEGTMAGFKNPAGYGLGSTTMAAAKFGGGQNAAGFEKDIPNIFYSLGAGGGILYLIIMYQALCSTMRVWTRGRSILALMIFGILVSQLGYWLLGGQYSTTALVWFLIGSIDRFALAPASKPDASSVTRRSGGSPAPGAGANRMARNRGRLAPHSRTTGLA